MKTNRAICFVTEEGGEKIYVSTLYGLLDVTHLVNVVDVPHEDDRFVTMNIDIDAVKLTNPDL